MNVIVFLLSFSVDDTIYVHLGFIIFFSFLFFFFFLFFSSTDDEDSDKEEQEEGFIAPEEVEAPVKGRR